MDNKKFEISSFHLFFIIHFFKKNDITVVTFCVILNLIVERTVKTRLNLKSFSKRIGNSFSNI